MNRQPGIKRIILPAAIFAVQLLPAVAFAESLRPDTVQAWDHYLSWADAKNQREISDPKGFLFEDFLPPPERARILQQVLAGQIVIRRAVDVVPSGVEFKVPNGEVHHWWGAVLVPGIKLQELMIFLKDYDHHAGRFPEVERSRLLSRQGDTFKFFFRLKRTKAIVTVYYNTWQECTYIERGPGRASSRSIATRIAEIENPGAPSERERPPGNDRGFLWRLVSWWRFEETQQGVIVECESASLSRDIPAIVRILPGVSSYIRSTPVESLESVLSSVRAYAKSR
jgi:hypothetical protein